MHAIADGPIAGPAAGQPCRRSVGTWRQSMDSETKPQRSTVDNMQMKDDRALTETTKQTTTFQMYLQHSESGIQGVGQHQLLHSSFADPNVATGYHTVVS